MKENLGDFLKKARNAKKLALRDVEKKVEVSNAYLSQLENNRIKNPSPRILQKLSEVYEVSYNRLLELAGYQPPNTEQELKTKFRSGTPFGNITENEREKLIEYLEFLRSKGK